jgi:MFS family permease
MKRITHGNEARLAVLAAFFVNGFLLAAWVSRIPVIQTSLGLSEGQLGLVLVGTSVGVITALTMAGGLIGRYGSKRVAILSSLALALSLPVLALMPGPVALFAALFIFGALISTMDMAMNAQGVAVEERLARPVMSSFHGAFSVGGLAGALLGSATAALGLGPLAHFAVVSVLSILILLLALRALLDTSDERQEGGRLFRLPPRVLWGLGAVAFCVAIGEGLMTDWSGVYLAREIGTTAAYAALGFAAFSLTMTLGRLFGDALVTRFDPVLVVRLGGLLAAAGILLAAFTNNPVLVLVGFAAGGAGLANGIPLAFSAAGRFPGLPPGVGIAGVATIGYAGFLAGPPVIGLVADATSLRVSLVLAAVLVGTIGLTAQAMRPSAQQATAAQE